MNSKISKLIKSAYFRFTHFHPYLFTNETINMLSFVDFFKFSLQHI